MWAFFLTKTYVSSLKIKKLWNEIRQSKIKKTHLHLKHIHLSGLFPLPIWQNVEQVNARSSAQIANNKKVINSTA